MNMGNDVQSALYYHRALIALKLSENYNKILTTLLIGNNIVNTTASTIGESQEVTQSVQLMRAGSIAYRRKSLQNCKIFNPHDAEGNCYNPSALFLAQGKIDTTVKVKIFLSRQML